MTVFSMLFGAFVAAILLAAFGVLVLDVYRSKRGSGWVLALGFFALFVGERVIVDGSMRTAAGILAIVVLATALALRAYAMAHSIGDRRSAHQSAMRWSALSAAAVALYALTLPSVTELLGLTDDATQRWNAVWKVLFPIVAATGALVTLALDRLLAVHPLAIPSGAVRSTRTSALVAALSVALVFPVNYLASERKHNWDVAYFQTTQPGDRTVAAVLGLGEPAEAVLFYAPGSETGLEIQTYFEALAARSDGQLSVRVVDQAYAPDLAKTLQIRNNGHVVLRQGDAKESFAISPEFSRAKRELKKLDGTVYKNLSKLSGSRRNVTFLTGHGEAHWNEKDDRFRKFERYKKDVLELSGHVVDEFGIADGSASLVPADTDLVVVAGPKQPLLPEEIESLTSFWDDGGSLLVLIDAQTAPLEPLLAHLGVKRGEGVLANATAFLRATRGPADRTWLATNKYGSHAAVKTLARNSSVAHLGLPQPVPLSKIEGSERRVTTLVRTLADTWADLNGNFEADGDEAKSTFDVALAIESNALATDGTVPRAVVLGSTSALSDDLLRLLRANHQFGYDSVRWLLHDDQTVGEIENEEDVKVVHTREDDWLWFLTAIVAWPAMILVAGAGFIRLRQRGRA